MQPVPSWVISALFFLSAALCLYSGVRYKDWTGRLFAPVLLAFAGLYYYYTVHPEIEVVIRQVQVRWGLVVLGLATLIWRMVVLWIQRGKQ